MAGEELDVSGVRTYPLAARRSLIHVAQFRRPVEDPAAISPLLASFPDVLGSRNLLRLVAAVREARRKGRGVIFALGGHVAKVGAAVHLLPLLRDGTITHVAINGAFLIHDYELGRWGATSEDVAAALPNGEFGLARETCEELNALVARAAAAKENVATLAGQQINERGDFAEWSLLATAAAAGVQVTTHVALGADIIHQHPAADGRAWGEVALADFRRLAAAITSLNGGGVFVNVGSAVILPEVFVKALNLARHLRPPVNEFTTANLDMIQHYRPRENVLARPTSAGGEAIAITGHHEILIPLLTAAIRAKPQDQ